MQATALISDSPVGEVKTLRSTRRRAPSATPTRFAIRKDRVEQRLQDLNQTGIGIARTSGLARTFINDLLRDRKSRINQDNLAKLAAALDCAPDYLTGESDFPGVAPAVPGVRYRDPEGLPLVDVIEPGVTTPKARPVPNATAPLASDTRFSGLSQEAYLVGSDALASAGMPQGTYLTVIRANEYLQRFGAWRDGKLVVVAIQRPGDQGRELTVRRVMVFTDRIELVPVGHKAPTLVLGSPPDGARVDILGAVARWTVLSD